MNPSFRRVALIAASLGLLVSLYFALRPGDEEAGPTTAITTTAPAPPDLRERRARRDEDQIKPQ